MTRPRAVLRRAALDAAAGAVAGTLATVPMSAVMLGAQRLGLMGEQPPRKVTDEAVEAVDAEADDTTRDRLTVLAHLGFGAAGGVPLALVLRCLPASLARLGRRRTAAAAGAAYGLAVWTSAYMGWVPALGIMPRADHDRPGRPESMIAAHLVYGGALGALVAWLRLRPSR